MKKKEQWKVVRVIKPVKGETEALKFDQILGMWESRANLLVEQGLVEIVEVEEEEDEDEESGDVPAGPAWEDPELGTFHFDGFGWTAQISAPSFDAFKRGKRRGKTPKTYPLTFVTSSADEKPTPAAVALAKRFLSNQATLATKTAEALWADFVGTGPESGMYWHGDLDQVAEGMDTGEPPSSAAELFKLMILLAIQILTPEGTPGTFAVELNFDAKFEEEHGVGILTDGSEVIGIGYSGDVSPFPSA